ncbi:hypothetical protein ACFVS9_28330 [Streptomyces sp. NPDC058008]|uniref:hypothetical protein n=1 Tax=Streptomyces sp. NPDC058008 TaxID=3346303 RepID=UPI0036EB68AE
MMDKNLEAALRLVTELQQLNGADILANPNQTAIVRVTVRTIDGQFAGEAILNPRATEELGDATSVVTGFALTMPADYLAGRSAPGPELDPLLIAAIEAHFDDIDPQSYLADVFDSQDAEASLAAYEQMVTGEWDGDL